MTRPSDLTAAVVSEIRRFHVALVDWITGAMPAEDFDTRIADPLHPALTYVKPSGKMHSRDEILAMLRGSHGANPEFAITISDVTIRGEGDDWVLATYIERQTGAKLSADTNSRITSVIFDRAARPRWRHLHETDLGA